MEDKVKQAVALAAALEKIETYIPTVYKNNSEPDLDEIHLNHAENGIARVTNALNGAIDVIKALQTGKIDTTKLVNNFLSTDPTAVAAAPTVKNLDARVTQLNGEIMPKQTLIAANYQYWAGTGSAPIKLSRCGYVVMVSLQNDLTGSDLSKPVFTIPDNYKLNTGWFKIEQGGTVLSFEGKAVYSNLPTVKAGSYVFIDFS